MDDEEDVEVIKSNKGGMKVIHKGYMYTVHKRRQCGGIRWRCAQRSLHCKGSISTGVEGAPKVNMPHNHLPDLHSVALARGRQVDEFGDLAAMLELKLDDSSPPVVAADSMPLQERLEKSPPDKQHSPVLKSQPLSPTKLKVTRQATKMRSAEFTSPPSSSSAASSSLLPPPRPPPAPKSPANEEMCLRWNSHHSNMQTAFPSILDKEQFVDVTLAAEGKTLKCHRLILSSCSPYFEEILGGIGPMQHPVLFMKDIPFWILKSLCDFMYAGEVHVFQNKLEELLVVAEALKIKGLAGKTTQQKQQPENTQKTNNNNNKSNSNNNNNNNNNNTTTTNRGERRIASTGRRTTTNSDNSDDLLDPLDLLEPLYEEVQEENKQQTVTKPKYNVNQSMKKNAGIHKRIKKRKYSEQREPSPPPVFSFRKGTRSRPNVKIPKYYHSDYENINNAKLEQKMPSDPLLDVGEIKTEPIDVEDNIISYSDDMDNHSHDSPQQHFADNNDGGNFGVNEPSEPLEEREPELEHDAPELDDDNNEHDQDGGNIVVEEEEDDDDDDDDDDDSFKKIKLSNPVISDVHTMEGGLDVSDVFKITIIEPPDVANSEDNGIVDPLDLNNDAISERNDDTQLKTTITTIQDELLPIEGNQQDHMNGEQQIDDDDDDNLVQNDENNDDNRLIDEEPTNVDVQFDNNILNNDESVNQFDDNILNNDEEVNQLDDNILNNDEVADQLDDNILNNDEVANQLDDNIINNDEVANQLDDNIINNDECVNQFDGNDAVMTTDEGPPLLITSSGEDMCGT